MGASQAYIGNASAKVIDMHFSPATIESTSEADILARFLSGSRGEFTLSMARFIVACKISDADKARMHDLAERNQNDELSEIEKAEFHAYAQARTVISILKAQARQTLRHKPKKRS